MEYSLPWDFSRKFDRFIAIIRQVLYLQLQAMSLTQSTLAGTLPRLVHASGCVDLFKCAVTCNVVNNEILRASPFYGSFDGRTQRDVTLS